MSTVTAMTEQLAEGVAAGLGGIICTTILYPMEIVKNQLQVMTNSDEKQKDKSAGQPTFRSVGAVRSLSSLSFRRCVRSRF